jgi:hypothetical protein
MRFPAGLAALCLLTGCSHPAVHVTQAPAPNLTGGWQTANDAEDGVSIGVAPGWREGADTVMSPMGMAAGVADQTSGQDPSNPAAQLQNQLQADDKAQEQKALADLKAKGVIIQVIDGSRPTIGEERTRYYIKKVDHGGNCSLDQAAADEQEHLRGYGADPPQTVTLPIGKALKFTADSKTRGGDESTHVSYVIVDGKNAYHLRFVSTNNPQAIQSIADQVAQTLRIAPSKS